MEFVAAVLECGHAEWIGLRLHWYGDVAKESIPVHERRWIHVTELTANDLRNVEDDVLYAVTRKRVPVSLSA